MVYGIISQLDDKTTLDFFQSKRVAKENIVHINFLPKLIQVLNTDDVVYVISVNRFTTVSLFMNFGKFCMQHGVTLHLLAQPYLDLCSGKHWKPSTIRQMTQMVEVERRATAKMAQGFQMTKEQWEYVYRCFEIMNLEILAQMFSPDGVLKRGN